MRKISGLELVVILAVVPFCTWCIIQIIQHTSTQLPEDYRYIAVISVTDRAGNQVRVKPKSVVCLAERTGETLICRVESVR